MVLVLLQRTKDQRGDCIRASDFIWSLLHNGPKYWMRNVTKTNDFISSKGEHFHVMMDVFIVVANDLDNRWWLYFILSSFYLTSAALTGSNIKQLREIEN